MNYTPFEGDGRRMVRATVLPMADLPGTQPIPVTRARARQMIFDFIETGRSDHSGAGSTLWVMLTWLQTHKIPYQLNAVPGKWYGITKVDPPT